MLDFAVGLAREAGRFILEHTHTELCIEHKGPRDLVTQVDMAAQRLVVERIAQAFPQHGILAEEGFSRQGSSDLLWLVDPLDGTTNYVHGLPIFCVSIALVRAGEPCLGVCYNPVSQELYRAESGQGSFLGDTRLQVSQTPTLKESLIATGFAHVSPGNTPRMQRLSRVMERTQGLRRLGSAALDLCYVAAGRLDAFWEEGLQPWDTAAGVVILREAGGRVTDTLGEVYDPFGTTILASNGLIHDKLRALL